MYLNNYISSFGTRLQAAREAVGMTQTQFAEKVIRRSGRSIDAGAYIKRISAWENGRIKGSNCPGSKINMPTINELAEFCDILDVDIDYLLGVQDKPRKEIADAAVVTGLSYEALAALKTVLSSAESKAAQYRELLNQMFCNAHFHHFLATLIDYLEARNERVVTNINNTAISYTDSQLAKAEARDELIQMLDSCDKNRMKILEHLRAAKHSIYIRFVIKRDVSLLEAQKAVAEQNADVQKLGYDFSIDVDWEKWRTEREAQNPSFEAP